MLQISCRYDVFLSFRGEDTRKKFTDHLYTALNRIGIQVFRDDKELKRGTTISPGLFKAIEESRIFVVIFSRNYAYSTWCLDELVKIVECTNKSGERSIFPIFYDVEPAVVRKQIANFQEAFAKHEEGFRQDIERVQKWRDSLKEVANVSGWELKDRNESEFIQDIVREISSKLSPRTLRTFDGLVGINSRIKELMRLLGDTESNEVRMIGICGMGGLGKTTLARVVYDLISCEFEGRSFLADVREISKKSGVISLQKQLLFQLLRLEDCSIWNIYDGINMIGSRLQHKKVLVVIDDVIDEDQLHSLVGNRDWFGAGSKIIITSRDEHLLRSHGVDEVYKPKMLNYHEALQLFCSKAFKTHNPLKEYMELSEYVVEYAGGLPLALKVLGSSLFNRNIDEWKSAIQRLKRNPEKKILDVLQISYDGLEETEKRIFLDIACFFKGKDRDYVKNLLDYCDFDPVIGISILIEKSLVTISKGKKLWMHDLLEEMGQQIVIKDSLEEPGNRSRLWNETDVFHVLTKNSGTEMIEAIILEPPGEVGRAIASAKAFSNMTKLRLLKICNVQLPEGLEYLSNELRFLDWHGYTSKSLPPDFKSDKVVELNMRFSYIEQMWKGLLPLSKLKFMRLNHSRNLRSTPDFTGAPNLEELILEGCIKLHEIHPSLLVHKKLILLNMKGCVSLTTLPSEIAMESLKKLVFAGCLNLKIFPEIVGHMECLQELHLDGTAIEELPLSIGRLTGLALLTLENCTNLVRIPSAISDLASLETLNLSGCSKDKNLPKSLGQEECLEELNVTGTAIRKPGLSFSPMKNLKALFSHFCKVGPSSTSWYLPFPINLMPARSSDSIALKLPSLSSLYSLKKLNLSNCNLEEGGIPSDIGSLISLEELDLSKNNFVSLPTTINRLCKLTEFKVEDCKRLQSLPQLPSNIQIVSADGCALLGTLSDSFKLCKSKVLFIRCGNCLRLFCRTSLAFSILKGFLELQLDSITKRRFDIVIPGSEIPEWLSYRNQHSSVKLVNPSCSYNSRKLLGYAVGCVFHIHKNPPTVKQLLGTHRLELYVESMLGLDQESRTGFRALPRQDPSLHLLDFYVRSRSCSKFLHLFACTEFAAQSGQSVSDHIWLVYLPRKIFDDHGFCPRYAIEFSFTAEGVPGLEVKMSGAHPVYMDEVEAFNETTNSSSSIVRDYVGAEASGACPSGATM